jgi:hypothetical protein
VRAWAVRRPRRSCTIDQTVSVGYRASHGATKQKRAQGLQSFVTDGRMFLSFFPRERTREAFVSMYVYLAQKILNICIDQKQKAGGRRTAGLNSGARHHHAATLAGGTPAHSSIQLAQKPAIFSRSRPSIHILLGDSLHCTEPPLLYQSYFSRNSHVSLSLYQYHQPPLQPCWCVVPLSKKNIREGRGKSASSKLTVKLHITH